jgi:hypothetical protein
VRPQMRHLPGSWFLQRQEPKRATVPETAALGVVLLSSFFAGAGFFPFAMSSLRTALTAKASARSAFAAGFDFTNAAARLAIPVSLAARARYLCGKLPERLV